MECTHHFGLEQMEQQIFDFIIAEVNDDNCFQIVENADAFHLDKLKNEVMEMISSRFHILCSSLYLSALDVSTMVTLLKRQDLFIKSELNVLEAISKFFDVEDIELSSILVEIQSQADFNQSKKAPVYISTSSRLKNCVDVERFSEPELKIAIRFSQIMGLKKLYDTCLEKLLGNDADIAVSGKLASSHRRFQVPKVPEENNKNNPKKCLKCTRRKR